MDLNRALEYALDGDAVLFVGAGFSLGAVNIRGTTIKTGGAFAKHLAALAGLPADFPLDEAADEFERSRGKDALIEELKGEFTIRETSADQQSVVGAPWRRIYTTNYDSVLQHALGIEGKSAHTVTPSNDIRSIPKEGLVCIHLNGFIDRVTRSTIGSEIKLTDTSYLSASIAQSSWAVLFRQDLASASAVFFVGYSLYDLDIRRILFEDPQLREKSFFFLGPNPDEATSRRAARFGKALHQGTTELATLLNQKRGTYSPRVKNTPIFHCFRPYVARTGRTNVADTNLYELFMYGVVREELVRASIDRNALYFRDRNPANQIVSAVARGSSVAVVHSRLGNGKSLVLEATKYRLTKAGYRVFAGSTRTERMTEELREILALPDKVAVVIDNYPDWLEAVETFGMYRSDRSVLILAARTAAHDVLVDRMEDLVASDVIEFSVDHLSNADVSWVQEIFDTYGLWGERAAWSRKQKEAYLTDVCRSEFHAILLGLLDSPDILKRLEGIIHPISARGDYYEAIITMLVLSLVGHVPTLDMVADLTGPVVLETGFRRNDAIKQLVDFQRGSIRLRSSVAAQFILKRITDPYITVGVMVNIARAADKAARANPVYRDLFRTLMRFSTIQEVLPNDPSGAALFTYYESIKTLEGARRNPLFWLQYGIAALSLDELERAERYLDSAYAFADQWLNYNTFQIDNHYARLLLLRASRGGTTKERMEAFRKARRIVNEQIKNERRHYPYRVAKLYRDFYEYSESDLTDVERQEVLKAAAFVLRRIHELPEERQRQQYVRECRRALEAIVPKATLDEVA